MNAERVDVDLDRPEIDLDADTVPARLLEGGYVPERTGRGDPKGVWVVRSDGHRKLVPWSEINVPSAWQVLP